MTHWTVLTCWAQPQVETPETFIHLPNSSDTHLLRLSVLLINTALRRFLQLLTSQRQFWDNISKINNHLTVTPLDSSECDPLGVKRGTVRIKEPEILWSPEKQTIQTYTGIFETPHRVEVQETSFPSGHLFHFKSLHPCFLLLNLLKMITWKCQCKWTNSHVWYHLKCLSATGTMVSILQK